MSEMKSKKDGIMKKLNTNSANNSNKYIYEKEISFWIDQKYPGLWEKIKEYLLDCEAQYCHHLGTKDTDFLWHHSLEVAHIALAIAKQEKQDVSRVAVAAMLHDAGKFADGKYHQGDISEEAIAAQIAGSLLASVKAADSDAIVNSIAMLYHADSRHSTALEESTLLSDIVHDADRLSKLGFLGIANFFLKAGMRAKPILPFLSKGLSKELTYAANAHVSMLTRSGQAIAKMQGRDSYQFLNGLLDQMQFWGMFPYWIEKKSLSSIVQEMVFGDKKQNKVSNPSLDLLKQCLKDLGESEIFIYLVCPEKCPVCATHPPNSNNESMDRTIERTMAGSVKNIGQDMGQEENNEHIVPPADNDSKQTHNFFQWHFSLDQGIKCRKLMAVWQCTLCGHELSHEFCLPEIFASLQ